MQRQPARSRQALSRAEKSFYLDEFHAHTLCFSARLSELGDPADLLEVARELIANDTRIVLLLGENRRRPAAKTALQRVLRNGLVTPATAPLLPRRRGATSLAGAVKRFDGSPGEHHLEELWQTLRRCPVFVGLVDENELLDFAQWIAGRLRIAKWVILDPRGGLRPIHGAPISFMDEPTLGEALRTGAAEWAGFHNRRATLRAVREALRQGVQAVNLCAQEQLATELFTYEGSGTLFTLEDYCRIERLGIDEFEEVERLLERGEREGFLKERDESETAAILLNGFGATIGQHHLAGVCGLLTQPYRRARAGEVAGLYTMTRFKSEGIGARLLARLLDEARELGLRYVFACTTDGNAAEFFVRHGFRRVRRSQVPAAKWEGYHRERLDRLAVLRRDLS